MVNSLKIKKEQKNHETGHSWYTYQDELDKAFFQHDMAYGDFKDLNRRAAADKVLYDKAFNNTKNPKYDGYQCELASMVYKLLIKKPSGWAATLTNKSAVKNENISNKELAEELHKQLKILIKEKYTHISKTIFGVQSKQICNW